MKVLYGIKMEFLENFSFLQNYRKVEIRGIKHVYRLLVQSFSINFIEDLCHNELKQIKVSRIN